MKRKVSRVGDDFVPIDEMPVGTAIKDYVQTLVNKECDLHFEIERLQYELRELKNKKKDCEQLMVEAFIEAKMFWMFRIDRTKLRQYLTME